MPLPSVGHSAPLRQSDGCSRKTADRSTLDVALDRTSTAFASQFVSSRSYWTASTHPDHRSNTAAHRPSSAFALASSPSLPWLHRHAWRSPLLCLLLLFASVSLASFAPDIVDLGPRILRSATEIWMPALDASPPFPWHWPDGSGSMYSTLSKAPEPTRVLDIGHNRIISWTNHLIVVAFAASGIFVNPGVFRFCAPIRSPRRRRLTAVVALGLH